jgi:hypothetical protein
MFRIKDLKAKVPFDDLSHERGHRASASGNIVQDYRAFRVAVHLAFYCFNLSANAPDAVQKLVPILGRVSCQSSLQEYPARYMHPTIIMPRSRIASI